MAKGSKMADRIRSNVDRVRKQPKSDLKSVPPHRHCVVCRAVIKVDADPPVCSNEDCNSKHQRNERSRKQLSILMYIFPAIAILLVILNVTQGGGA
jgi:predicted nucleic acid-binding Zn ribbon protein